MNVVNISLGFVEVLLAIEMHQVEFVDQPELFEKVNRAVHRGPVDLPISPTREFQQGGGVQVPIGLLNRFEQDPPLAGDADTPQRQFL